MTKSKRHTFPIQAETAQRFLDQLTATPTDSPLSIHALEAEHYAPYIADIRDRAKQTSGVHRPKVTLLIEGDVDQLPAPIPEQLTHFETEYQAWKTETSIQENFTDDSLTKRVYIPFDQSGSPTKPEIELTLEFWGLPESAIPALSEIAL